jgi:anti-sigma regulatory factor (Ser/Thr protein kinase)
VTPETAQLIPPREAAVCVFERSWHATPNNVSRSRRALLATLREEDLAEPVLDAIGLAVAAVTTNTVYHGYVGRRIGQFQITAATEADAIKVTVEDDGCGFETPEAAPNAGRGLGLVASLAERVETSSRSGGGTVTTMWFARTR